MVSVYITQDGGRGVNQQDKTQMVEMKLIVTGRLRKRVWVYSLPPYPPSTSLLVEQISVSKRKNRQYCVDKSTVYKCTEMW